MKYTLLILIALSLGSCSSSTTWVEAYTQGCEDTTKAIADSLSSYGFNVQLNTLDLRRHCHDVALDKLSHRK